MLSARHILVEGLGSKEGIFFISEKGMQGFFFFTLYPKIKCNEM